MLKVGGYSCKEVGGMAGRVRKPCARALYGFQGQSRHELNFSAGVSIMLLRRVDENWLEGNLDGKIGIFPASHVKIEVGSPSSKLKQPLCFQHPDLWYCTHSVP